MWVASESRLDVGRAAWLQTWSETEYCLPYISKGPRGPWTGKLDHVHLGCALRLYVLTGHLFKQIESCFSCPRVLVCTLIPKTQDLDNWRHTVLASFCLHFASCGFSEVGSPSMWKVLLLLARGFDFLNTSQVKQSVRVYCFSQSKLLPSERREGHV